MNGQLPARIATRSVAGGLTETDRVKAGRKK